MQIKHNPDIKTITVSFVCDYCGCESKRRVKNEGYTVESFVTKPLAFCSRICEKLHKEEHELDDIINASKEF
jgi:hypothetical protein